MKKITKARVAAFLKEREEAGNPVPPLDKEAQKDFRASLQSIETFVRTVCAPVQAAGQPTQVGATSLEASFSSSLKGSKWEAHVTGSKDSFVSKEYRMLSQTWVNHIYNFGFEDGKALRAAHAAGMFNDKKFYKDHNMSVDAVVGVVGLSTYDESSDYPAPGVNNTVFVDQRLDAPFALRFQTELVDSVSVGINFKKLPTHAFEDQWDFWLLLGQEVDGERVGFNVTEIINIVELSSVYDGADPFAKVKGTFTASDDAAADELESMLQEPVADRLTSSDSVDTFDALAALDALASKHAETVAAMKLEDEVRRVELEAVKLELASTKILADKYAQFVGAHGGEKAAEALIKAGQAVVLSRREELLRFMTVTGKAAFTKDLVQCEDVERIFSLHQIFKSEIDSSIPLTCPNCKTLVSASRQQSVDFAQPVQAIHVAATNEDDAKDIDSFCHDIHK